MAMVQSERSSPAFAPRRGSQELRGFAEALNAESDHACAVLAAACLDATLAELFRAHMTTEDPAALFDGAGPLASFGAKIDVAYAMGWLSLPERDDLHAVRAVGEGFARDLRHDLSFGSPSVRAECEPLQHASVFLAEAGLPDSVFATDLLREFRASARPRFELTIGFLRQALIFRIGQAEHAPPLPGLGS